MEINKSCLDCKFSDWYAPDSQWGNCQWRISAPFAIWLDPQAQFFKTHNTIKKISPYVDCPAWADKEEVENEAAKKNRSS